MFKGKDWKNTDGKVNLGVVIKVKRHKKKAKVNTISSIGAVALWLKCMFVNPGIMGSSPIWGTIVFPRMTPVLVSSRVIQISYALSL
jgi:hypothetical protein